MSLSPKPLTQFGASERFARNLLFGLSALFLVILPSALFLAAAFISLGSSGLDLSGPWNQCALNAKNVEEAKTLIAKCEWTEVASPIRQMLETYPNTTFRVLRKRFVPPSYCNGPVEGCSILFGRIGDSSEFYLGTQFLGRFIDFAPNFLTTYAYSIQVPLPKTPSVETEFTVVSKIEPGPSTTRLDGPPISVLPTHTAFRYAQILTTYTVSFPIFTAGMTLLLGTITALIGLFFGVTGRHDDKLKWISLFSISSAVYLLSLSRIPREFVSLALYPPIHYLARSLADYSTLRLYEKIWDAENLATRLFSKFLIVSAAFYVVSIVSIVFFPNGPTSGLYHLSRVYSFTMVPTIIVLGIIGGKLISTKKQVFVGWFTLVLALMELVDFLSFSFSSSDFFAVRFTYHFKVLIILFSAGLAYSQLIVRVINEAVLGRTISVLLHDLKSTAMALRILTSHGKQEFGSDDGKILSATLNRLSSMTQEVLSIGKQQRDSKSSLLRTNAKDVLTQVSDEHKLIATQTGGSITSDIQIASDRLVEIPGHHLYRMVGNLVINSLEAKQGSNVMITARDSDGYLSIKVADNAGGFRSEAKTNGNGIGLFSCRLLTESYGGTLAISSTPNVGTDIEIRLPIVSH